MLGDLGIALCGPDGGAAVHLHLDVATGNLSLADEAGSSAVDAVAAAGESGASIGLERFLCNLEHMNCSWVDVQNALTTAAEGYEPGWELPLMDRRAARRTLPSPGLARCPPLPHASSPPSRSGHSRLRMRSRTLIPRPDEPLRRTPWYDPLELTTSRCRPPTPP